VAITETETISSNARVLGADPLVDNGIGEEDILTVILPYINSAKEGVLRLGTILARYGTYEMNVLVSKMKMKYGGLKLSEVIIG